MPSPYTIQESAQLTGLSVKFIRRLKDSLPLLFEKHTERGNANALLFDEEIIEVLRRVNDLKNRGKTLNQIRREMSQYVADKREEMEENIASITEAGIADDGDEFMNELLPPSQTMEVRHALERENSLLRSQVDLLQTLVRNAEQRFDRLLPEATERKSGWKTLVFNWVTEAAVVTALASAFIALFWYAAQNLFS
jgi:DNA-binding transcriptional MerR regulator